MPRFYFDINDGTGIVHDTEGSEHHGLDAAQHEAVETLALLGREIFPQSGDRELSIEIRGEEGKTLMRTRLSFLAERV